MKKFMLLHYGFEMPTPEIMQAWGVWFEDMADHMLDRGAHFKHGREINKQGVADMPLGPDSITGYNIIQAESLEAAEALAAKNPFIKSIRVYEMMGE